MVSAKKGLSVVKTVNLWLFIFAIVLPTVYFDTSTDQ